MKQVINESDFRRIANYLVCHKKLFKAISSIDRISNKCIASRVFHTEVGKFLIKIFWESFPSDKNFFHLQNEIVVQKKIKNLGFHTKDYLIVELNSNSSTRLPFVVSNYISGRDLGEVSKDKAISLIPKVLDRLFLLHSMNISQSFGYLTKELFQGPVFPFGRFESTYLKRDIQRDKIEFSDAEKKNLNLAIDLLNEDKSFCLCHWDITKRNILYDDSAVHLIDWRYAHYANPASDIAGVIFWIIEFDLMEQMSENIVDLYKRYLKLGFDISLALPFYLGQRYIEVGRIKGASYVARAKKFLEVSSKPLDELIKIMSLGSVIKG